MQVTQILASAEVASGTLAGAVVVSGLLTVFSALVILIAAVWIMGKVLHREKPAAPSAPAPAAAPKAAPAAPAPAAAPPAQATADVEEETVAVITAAIAATMNATAALTGTPVAPWGIAGIQPAGGAAPRSMWELAGLMQNTKPF